MQQLAHAEPTYGAGAADVHARRRLRTCSAIGAIARHPARHHVPHSLADVDGVVANALVEATDKRKLHRDRQVDTSLGVALEDRLDEVDLEPVEVVVDVVERGGERCSRHWRNASVANRNS